MLSSFRPPPSYCTGTSQGPEQATYNWFYHNTLTKNSINFQFLITWKAWVPAATRKTGARYMGCKPILPDRDPRRPDFGDKGNYTRLEQKNRKKRGPTSQHCWDDSPSFIFRLFFHSIFSAILPVHTWSTSPPYSRSPSFAPATSKTQTFPVPKHDPAMTASELWNTKYHEARMLAVLLMNPKVTTDAEAERLLLDVVSWDLCDHLCKNLFLKMNLWKIFWTVWPGGIIFLFFIKTRNSKIFILPEIWRGTMIFPSLCGCWKKPLIYGCWWPVALS